MRRRAVHVREIPTTAPAPATDYCHSSKLRLGFLALVLICSAIPAISESLRSAELTTVRQIRHLKVSTPTGVAVHLRGVVTYYDTVAPNLFVQDATGGIWV